MAIIGVDSVAYHRATVVGRADDYPGQALAYYGSRGETPLEWGGSGARALGLEGNVTEAQYEAIFGVGGACDPTTGERLVTTKRPGLELVISAHKSLAELGVIGRAEDMHAIHDAEREATLAYLDDLTRRLGGRRGRDATRAPTEGLVYAVVRHATSRAGDPCPHDHVLLANVVAMGDGRGGWKAADTALWRSHVHAATAVGRLAAAHEAVGRGYAIAADDGPSGRLGHWAIAGIPQEVMEMHSKRAAVIGAEMTRLGYASNKARGIAARNTRAPKRHQPVGELMARWKAEIEAAAHSVEALNRAVEQAALHWERPSSRLDRNQRQGLVAEVLGPDGPLARRKVWSRRDVVVAVAPALFGRDPYELQRVVEGALADPESVPLLGVPGAIERAYATAATIAREQAIAACVAEDVERRSAPAVAIDVAQAAVVAKEVALGRPLTSGQRHAVVDIATSGRGADLIVGVAGAGKTTALDALRQAFESDGYQVVGTSTSGQAARTLGREARIAESRTLASLLWRLEHRRLELTPGHVVILDEAGMTDDGDLLRLLAAAHTAGAKVVAVGDPRQLGAVGPGGGFESLVRRYGAAVHLMGENVRQRDPDEREALAHLRAGEVAQAVGWYAEAGRIVVAPDHDALLDSVVAAWATDATRGAEVAMFAWRRANAAELNRRARAVWAEMGRLSGPKLRVPGGAAYRGGDRIVTLAPGPNGTVVTSETGTVVHVIPEHGSLVARMDDDGRHETFTPEMLEPSRLAHGYAVTVHRAQGATVDVAHALDDGGGRELAYVKMSRARERSTVYLVADSVDQAVEELGDRWSQERRQAWAIDTSPRRSRSIPTPAGGTVRGRGNPSGSSDGPAPRHRGRRPEGPRPRAGGAAP